MPCVAPSSPAVGKPRTVGRYVLGDRIGAGGMAEVYRARAPGLGRASQDVALKIMHAHLANEAEFVRLFFREAQVASSLRHPNVVNVLDSGQDERTYFLAMEFVDGLSLRQLIRGVRDSGEPFDISAAVGIMSLVCAGLHHAHARTDEAGNPLGIVHRDVSPGNVLLSVDGAVKLGDFGVATATASWTALRSRTGSIRGKVAYMAPEQARGHSVDRRADVFAVANVLFELVEGHRLLQADGEVELLHELVFGGYGTGKPTREDCPQALADAIARGLSPTPEARFPTALAFAEALRSAHPPMDSASLAKYVQRHRTHAPKSAPSIPGIAAAPPVDPTDVTFALETATVSVGGTPSGSSRGPLLAIVGAGLLGILGAVVVFQPRGETDRRARAGFSFTVPTMAPEPVAEPLPVAEPAPEAPPEPSPEPLSKAPKRRKKSKRRRKKSTKPPPSESLFPH